MTAKEIYRALENNKGCSQRMLAFFRVIEDIDSFDAKKLKKFRDTNDNETQQLLTEIGTDIRNALPSENIFTYRVCINAVNCL